MLITHPSDPYKWRNKADIAHLQLPLNLFGCLLHDACCLYPPLPHGLQSEDKNSYMYIKGNPLPCFFQAMCIILIKEFCVLTAPKNGISLKEKKKKVCNTLTGFRD